MCSWLDLKMAHVNTPQSPVVVNVADFLKQIQRNRPPAQNVVNIGGQGPVVTTQHSSVSLLGGASTPVTASQGSINYSYKVKIINPAKKSDVMVRHMNNFTGKFETVMALRLKLIEAFSDHVPNTVDFSVGYYEGSQQSKVWLVTADDLKKMYESIKRGHITLCHSGVTKGHQRVSMQVVNVRGSLKLQQERKRKRKWKGYTQN